MDAIVSLAAIPLLPLAGSVIAYLAGRKVKDLAGWIATAAAAASFLVVLYNFLMISSDGVVEQDLFRWISAGSLQVDFTLRLDQLSAVMCLVVTGIGSLIHLYSIGYMSHDEGRPRFFAYLNLFLFAMLLLVLGGNMLVLFIGWEGVGLCSYLLIGFWHKNISFAAAGRKAFVVNRIGDAGFLLAMFLIFVNFGTFDFVDLQQLLAGVSSAQDPTLFALIALCLFVGATGKSAQIPLFVWLPDAMAGPTPVSALIHAATMVTAGVYMLARTHFLFSLAPLALACVIVIAVLTAFVAASTALVQNDIKKVLAYSTVSQLGFMFMAAGAGAYWVAIFHVVTHAFFKACLFLCAGSVIHGCHDEQDMRLMGGLRTTMPWTCLTYGIATIAIAGVAPFAGYYSKHAIVAALAHAHNPHIAQDLSSAIGVLVSVTALLTAFYMTRSFVMTFMGDYRGEGHPHESPTTMLVPLFVLAALSLVGGVGLTSVFSLQEYLGAVLPVGELHPHESLVAAVLHSGKAIGTVIVAYLLYTRFTWIPEKLYALADLLKLSTLFLRKWFFDEIYGALIVRPLELLARGLWKQVDQAVIDASVNGTANMVDLHGEVLRVTQTGQLRHYALFIFAASVALIGILVLV